MTRSHAFTVIELLTVSKRVFLARRTACGDLHHRTPDRNLIACPRRGTGVRSADPVGRQLPLPIESLWSINWHRQWQPTDYVALPDH